MNTNRRSVFKKIALSIGGIIGWGMAQAKTEGKVSGEVLYDQDIPLFSSAVAHGDLLFLAGKGAHFAGDIKSHTKHVLDELQKELEKNGSSMEQVLKVNVYLNDLKDYQSMNEVFRGRFGKNPPVRTTIAAAGGIPGDSLVEIDCIASLKKS